jgi:hypothetical protein
MWMPKMTSQTKTVMMMRGSKELPTCPLTRMAISGPAKVCWWQLADYRRARPKSVTDPLRTLAN